MLLRSGRLKAMVLRMIEGSYRPMDSEARSYQYFSNSLFGVFASDSK